jgi:hypothetical protein
MSKRLRSHRRAGLVVGAVVALALAAGSFAYLSSVGRGSGGTATDTVQPITISPGTPSQQLYPGGSSDVALTLANPNTAQLVIPALAVDPGQGTNGFAVDAAHASLGCSAADAQLAFAPQSVDATVPARVGATDGSIVLDLQQALTMGVGAADACQGASFTVYLKVAS